MAAHYAANPHEGTWVKRKMAPPVPVLMVQGVAAKLFLARDGVEPSPHVRLWTR